MHSLTPQRRRSPILPLAAFLLLITGLALYGVSTTISRPGQIRSSRTDAATLTVVERFYEAVNTVVRTGDVTTLDAILAPEFVDHLAAPSLPPDRNGLIRLLLDRYETMPRSHLVVDQTLIAGDQASVLIHVEADAPGTFLGLPLPDGATHWAPQEMLRIEGTTVVERWSSATSSFHAQPLWQHPLPIPSTDLVTQVISLELIQLAPGDQQILTGETATLIVSVASGRLTSTGEPATLTTGDHVSIPPARHLALANNRSSAANIIVVEIGSDTPSAKPPDARPFMQDVFSPGTTLAAGRLVLAPGATFAFPAGSTAVLAILETGQLDVAGPKDSDGDAHWQSFGSGEGIATLAMTGGTWRAADTEPSVLFVVTIGTAGTYDPKGPTR